MTKRQQHPDNLNMSETAVARAKHEIDTEKLEVAAIRTMHRGPLPSPDVLRQYEDICPGAADRIIVMAEKQSAHRQNLEHEIVVSQCRNSLLGVISGFLLGLAAIGGGVYATVSGFPWAGGFLGTAGLTGLVSVFVYGTQTSKREVEEKSNENASD